MWFEAMLVSILLIARFAGPRLRPRVVGASLIGCGLALHAAFELWVADRAGRYEMGLFAVCEGTLFVGGLGLALIDLASPRPAEVPPGGRGAWWLLWLAAAVVTGFAVLVRLPP